MNTITADILLKKKNEIYKKNKGNSNKIIPKNENIIDEPLQSVSDMNTFKRKLDESLRQSIFPQTTHINKQMVRKDTLFERPKNINDHLSESHSMPTQSKIRKRSQSQWAHTDVQTDALSLDIEDMYSIFNIKKKKNSCIKSSLKCTLITMGATVYSIGILAFQYYVIYKN